MDRARFGPDELHADSDTEIGLSLDVETFNKPGTCLELLIPDWAISFEEKCECLNMKNKMDKWGTRGCIARRERIVQHLVASADKLIPPLRALPRMAQKRGAGILADKAIRMSSKEKKRVHS